MSPGDLGAGIFGFIGGERQNYANAKQAAQQMDFQREQSETVHQRAVKDLLAAGLNPILSATRGGNPAMSGAQATMQNSAAAAIESRRQHTELQNLKAQTRNITEDSDLKRSQQQLNSRLYNTAGFDELLRRQQWMTEQEETKIRRNERYGSDVEGDIDSSKYGEFLRYINRIPRPGLSFGSSASSWARGRGTSSQRGFSVR